MMKKHIRFTLLQKLWLHEYKIPAADYAMVKKFFDGVLMGNEDRIVVKKD